MTTMSPMVRTATTVGDVLGRVHETWMEQVTTFLTPALNDEADFWTRWSVARFLSDQFRDWFRLERALLDALGPLVPDEASRTLATVRAGLEHTVEELVIAARRRTTGHPHRAARPSAHRPIGPLVRRGGARDGRGRDG